MTSPVRIPADVDREDRLIADLTARQLAILATAGTAIYTLWLLCFRWLPVWNPTWAQAAPVLRGLVFAAAAVPVAVAGLALALGRRDGMPLDRLLLAAARQRLATPTLRPQPHAAPAHTNDTLDTHRATKTVDGGPGSQSSRRRRGGAGRMVVPRVPARAVRASHVSREAGLVELGRAGLAMVCAVTPISLTLRSPAEQDQLVAGMARWLHSLTQGVQILVRTTPLDLTGHVDELRADAARLPHPALAAAAHAHTDHLTDLAQYTDPLQRRIYLVFHEPAPATTHQDDGGTDSAPPARVRRAVRAAEEQLLRRAEEAEQVLGAIGLRITPLDPPTTARTLHAATHPDQHLTPPLPAPPAHQPAAHPPRPPDPQASAQHGWSWPSPPPDPADRPFDEHAVNPAAPGRHAGHPGTPRRATPTPASATAAARDRWRSASKRWEVGDVDPDQVTADLYDPADLASLRGYELDDEQLEDHNLDAAAQSWPAAPAGRPRERDGETPPWGWAPGARGYFG